jgi:hypothetical protein
MRLLVIEFVAGAFQHLRSAVWLQVAQGVHGGAQLGAGGFLGRKALALGFTLGLNGGKVIAEVIDDLGKVSLDFGKRGLLLLQPVGVLLMLCDSVPAEL